jgi:hypothetical protein
MKASFVLLCALVVSGCASTGPEIRTDVDPDANFFVYRTYGYPSELGTDRAGYATIVTTYFRNAVDREMQDRGYRYVSQDPDLIVNFFANARDETDVRYRPDVRLGYGYYGYRFGMYTAWPLYTDRVDTVHYKVGTANIDIVDAKRRQLIWEAVAEGRLTQDVMNDPQPAIAAVVAELFQRFPGRAAAD